MCAGIYKNNKKFWCSKNTTSQSSNYKTAMYLSAYVYKPSLITAHACANLP